MMPIFRKFIATLAAGTALWSSGAQALTVFSCEPEWSALVSVILPGARIYTATTDKQDPHHIEARPALIAQLREADFAICTGAELEDGWLPLLQERSGNPRVQDGQPRMFYAAQAVHLEAGFMGVKTPFSGDVHRAGNPHVHTDPQRMSAIAKSLSTRLMQLYPDRAADIASRHQRFAQEWQQSQARWQSQAAALRQMSLVIQHEHFYYLWRWLGVRIVADLEPVPGMPPTPGHLQKTLAHITSQPARAIVIAHHQNPRPAQWLSMQTTPHLPVLLLPPTVAQGQSITQWFTLIMDRLSALPPAQARAETP